MKSESGFSFAIASQPFGLIKVLSGQPTHIKLCNRIPVRYQDGFSRKVQFISSEESGQSMFRSHLSSNLAGRANGNSQLKCERMINYIEDQSGPRTHPMQVPSLQLKLSSLHGVRFSSVSSFPWMQSS